MLKQRLLVTCFGMALFALLITVAARVANAQAGESLEDLKRQASDLIEQSKYTEALPLLEKIAVLAPNDGETQFFLGFALIAQAVNTKEESPRRTLRLRARYAFVKAKELRFNEPRLNALILSIPEDGSDPAAYSSNREADALMQEGEALFSQGKADEALAKYQAALQLDPKLYHAALFSGDIYLQKSDFDKAEIWYQKAIAIDPNVETAYRYSATPLMRQRKFTEARNRYVEAFITEPYNRFARAGLIQWGNATKTEMRHPQVDIPTDITFDEKGDANLSLDADALTGKDDGSFAWLAYGVTRSTWRKEKFSKTFPGERTYRHSLPEEAEALRSVLTLATSDKKTKNLSPSLATLKKLNDEGLLEAYLLLARADEGIAQDHPAYLKQNRDKLRRYVTQYLLGGGGE